MRGLKILSSDVKRELGVPVLTDIHEPIRTPRIAAKVVDVLQIPAFLARQTDLLIAAAETGKRINIKKGQFMAQGRKWEVMRLKVRSAPGEKWRVVGRGSEVVGRPGKC